MSRKIKKALGASRVVKVNVADPCGILVLSTTQGIKINIRKKPKKSKKVYPNYSEIADD